MIISTRKQLFSYLNPEQRLLITICSSQNTENIEEAKQWLAKPFNWDQLIMLSERHRLLPMLYRNIKEISSSVPVEIPQILKDKFQYQTQHVMKLASEGIRLSCKLNQEGVSNILLKGPFLSEQLYGDATLRPSRDIDILVLPENIERVDEIILSEGYRMVYPDFTLSRKQRNYYQKNKNQYAYRNPDNGCLVELHWRLFSQRNLFPITTEKVFAESQEQVMAGNQIRVLSTNHCLEYLCLHGSLHQWFRLLWLRDIAQMLADENLNLNEALLQAKKNCNERPIEQAAYLSNLFFGTNIPINLKSKKTLNSIASHAETAIISDEGLTLSHKINRLRIPIYKMKIKPGIAYKLSCWSILQPNFNDWKLVKLPDSIFFLYFPLRPFIWFYTVYILRNKKKKALGIRQ